MTGRLDSKVAVITGGTSGIGEATAELFVSEGAKVLICGRSTEKGAAIADRLGDACQFITADVMREDDIAKTIEFAAKTFGGIDILFNNAGGPTAGDIVDVDEDTIHYATLPACCAAKTTKTKSTCNRVGWFSAGFPFSSSHIT